MKKRTQGLKEFRLRRENIDQNMYETASIDCLRRVIRNSLPQLHTTICVSGWLREKYKAADFQAAWGVQPTDPLIESRWELLKRFYIVHDPEKVKSCEIEMKARKKKERKAFSWDAVWEELEKEYGCSPEHVLPTNVPIDAVASMSLSSQEQATINGILGKAVLKTNQGDSCDWTPVSPSPKKPTKQDSSAPQISVPEAKLSRVDDSDKQPVADTSSESCDSDDDDDSANNKQEDSKQQSKEVEEELVVWDWQAIYGSDLHTITWETEILQNMCHIANSMTRQVTSQATRLALQQAVFVGAVLSAVALPSSLLTATQVIDDPYQIVILRADEAGKELAKCLLENDERRPVTLVGYSFGARVIFSCLVELARLQDLWEEGRQHQEKRLAAGGDQSMSETSGMTGRSQSDDGVGQQREPASIVEDVVFMGLPRVIDQRMLRLARQVVGGRFINCYTRNDWLLTLMFLTRGGTQTCGTHPIQNIGGIENFNVTSLVQAHSKYAEAIPRILQRVGLGKPLALPNY
jgi:hypothetical protein